MSITYPQEVDRRAGSLRAAVADADDAELIERARGGDADAYGELYRRHEPAATRLARGLEPSKGAADDLVSEAFAAILAALRNGAGPTEAFRPYLLTTVRNRFWRRSRAVEDPADPSDGAFDGAVLEADTDDGRLMLEAYRRLPERWQLVLWHTEIEGSPPAEVAPLVGLSPHATAALAHRAREGLREAYLQAHLQAATPAGCAGTVEKLGALVRGNLGRRDQAKVDAHLDGCSHCRELRAELSDVNRALRSIVAPAVLGGAAAAYLGRRATSAPATRAIVETLGGATRRAAIVGGALAVAIGLLVLRSETSEPATGASPGPTVPPGATAGGSDRSVPAGGGRGSTAGVALPGGTVLTASHRGCDEQLSVAVSGSATPTGTGAEQGGVVRAVLFRGDVTGLPATAPSAQVTPVGGTALGTLRTLAGATAGGTTPPDGGACVTAPPSALLGGEGPWRLLVTYQPDGSTDPDNLLVAVLDQPFALLGSTTRDVLRTVRSTLQEVVDQLPGTAGAVDGALTGSVDGLGTTVDGVATTVDDLLRGLTGTTGPSGPTTPGPTPPAPGPVPGLPTGPVPPVTVPPTTPPPVLPLPPLPVPSLPSLPLPSLPLPPLLP